ncbi:hypothetical protein OQA88_3262 [Cercophora sp. LCS_1]
MSETDALLKGIPSFGTDLDVIIIGAGISGINTAYRLQTELPAGTTYAILEGRDALGGTWDLFKYPGIRSDSDISTFGFPWFPWRKPTSLASAAEIKDYMRKAAEQYGIDRQIRYHHHVHSANWDTPSKRWHLSVSINDAPPTTFTARFLLLGTGYYDYTTPLQAIIPSISTFSGEVVHPQFWPSTFSPEGKHIAIIGSGATAVTLLPTLAPVAKHVTMIQRSPSYIFSIPLHTPLVTFLFKILPASVAHAINRTRWLIRSAMIQLTCRLFPETAKKNLRKATEAQLPPDIKYDPHFKPRYNPWEQRLCACVDGDFFAAFRSGKAGVVTGVIKEVKEKEIVMEDGQVVKPDVIVTATGLKLRFGGGIRFSVDEEEVKWNERFAWRASMVEGVPNLVFLMGYEQWSWTLGADASTRLFVRVWKEMVRRGKEVVMPRVEGEMEQRGMMGLSSTYLKTQYETLPKAGGGLWGPKRNYLNDIWKARFARIAKGLVFS